MINAVYHDKPLMFIGAMFRKKLASHHQAENKKCWIRLSVSRLFLTLYLTWLMPFIMTNLWCLSGLCFGRSLSPIIRQRIKIAEYVWIYQGCFWHYIWHEKCRLSWQAFDVYRGYVSGEVTKTCVLFFPCAFPWQFFHAQRISQTGLWASFREAEFKL